VAFATAGFLVFFGATSLVVFFMINPLLLIREPNL
jgi:hypothetical protein